MPNDKIARIVANIEYRIPAGTIDKYKYGVKLNRVKSIATSSLNPDVVELDFNKAKQEFKEPQKPVKLPDPELIDD